MGAASSGDDESFENILLEYPHYTRPVTWEGRTIPEVLRSGIMRRSRPGGNNRRKIIHGYAGRPFGSAMRVLGTDLPLARGEKKRTRGHEPHPDERSRRNRQGRQDPSDPNGRATCREIVCRTVQILWVGSV